MLHVNGVKFAARLVLPAAAAAAIFFALYFCGDITIRTGILPWQNITSHDLEKSIPSQTTASRDLALVLERASTANRIVIITTVNEAWSAPNSVLDLFLRSFRAGEQTLPLLNHLVIVAVDDKAFRRCRSTHPHCFLLASDGGVDFTGEKRFMTADYLTLMWKRVDLLRQVLEMGYHFVFTDADVMWLRSPFRHFPPGADLTIACDRFTGNSTSLGNAANGGFVYARSNPRTVSFYKHWYAARLLYPGKHDQAVFDKIKWSPTVRRSGLRLRFLDTALFGGFCHSSEDYGRLCTLHANCCVGLERKVNDLGIVLQDWSRFRRLPVEERRRKGRSLWRIPDKCRM